MTVERVVCILCAVACAIVGYLLGAYRGEIKVKDIQLQAAVLRAEQGGAAYKKLVAAQDALDNARRDSADLRADAERVRVAYEDRLRRAKAATGGADGEDAARCAGLLVRCTDLLARGGELATGIAGKHDALIELVK